MNKKRYAEQEKKTLISHNCSLLFAGQHLYSENFMQAFYLPEVWISILS